MAETKQAMTDKDRLKLVEDILGLLPSGRDWQGRARYWAYQVALGNDDRAAEARARVKELHPAWVGQLEEFGDGGEG